VCVERGEEVSVEKDEKEEMLVARDAREHSIEGRLKKQVCVCREGRR